MEYSKAHPTRSSADESTRKQILDLCQNQLELDLMTRSSLRLTAFSPMAETNIDQSWCASCLPLSLEQVRRFIFSSILTIADCAVNKYEHLIKNTMLTFMLV